ncbi:MAG: cytochrome c biogenesis protein CcsA [Anaerolineae bacterium]
MIVFVIAAVVFLGFISYLFLPLVKGKWLGTVASLLLIAAWIMMLITLAVRGMLAGHWPLGSQYEFTLCFIWIVLTIYLLIESYWQEQRLGRYVTLVVLILMFRVITLPAAAREIGPLPPVLQSVWLQVHVMTVMVGYGAYGVAAGLGLGLLASKPTAAEAGISTTLPPQSKIRQMTLRLLALGFPWLSLGILTGAVWAHYSWGRYWGWDPKETWALITWIWYLFIFHAASLPAWRGKRLAWLVLAGFILVMFTFIGVPFLASALQIDTLHGY